ncbi:hypothetical protein MTR67_035128 [Solanum verrucosum]|uniref:Uncharacterized protein n=1 Tax=Solanum verrucosum TaxID=315347 RepID=A0AAF0U9J2_SOLVR|nr:hypothetical protein MTR67_035128 [Solanum verrucosum]
MLDPGTGLGSSIVISCLHRMNPSSGIRRKLPPPDNMPVVDHATLAFEASLSAPFMDTSSILIEEQSMDTIEQKGTTQLKERRKKGMRIAQPIRRVAEWPGSHLMFQSAKP